MAIANPPSVAFLGAVQSVTGSMHLVDTGRHRVLLDCGLILGHHPDIWQRNRKFPFDPRTIDAVILSHAHIDHCGNLPNLVAQGYQGPIYCTPPTHDLLGIMLSDSARIQEEEAEFWLAAGATDESSAGLLYTHREVAPTLEACVGVDYGVDTAIAPGLSFRLVNAGHLLGSAMVVLQGEHQGRPWTISFTGDLGRNNLAFLPPPGTLPPSDLVISESTYGGRLHASPDMLRQKLRETVVRTVERRGKVLIPAFSLGRAQIVVHYIEKGMRDGDLPTVPIYVDSPLAADIVDVFRRFPDWFHPDARQSASPLVRYVRDRHESKQLSRMPGPCVLVASGGMCEAGRVIHHLETNLDDPRNSVVLVSHQSPGSLGRKMMERGPTVRFRGKTWNKWADIVDLNGFSGHGDQADLRAALRPQLASQPRVFMVHGDPEASTQLATALRSDGFRDVRIPTRGEQVPVIRA